MKLASLVICIIFLEFSQAQVISAQDGNWSDGSTWVGGSVPGNFDQAIINHKVNFNTNDIVGGITINDTLINDGFRIRCTGDWVNNGFYIDSTGRVQFRRNVDRVISGSTSFNQVIIENNGTATVTGVMEVKAWLRLRNGILDVSGGDLILKATSTTNGRIGTCVQGNIIGTFTSERYVGRCNGWSWYGGPFDGSLADYAATSGGRMVYTGFPGSNVPTFHFINAYFYDENWSNVGYTGYVVPSGVSDVISRGTGFWYWNSDTVYNSGQASIPQMWKMELTGDIDFQSTFNFSLFYTNTGNTGNDGWNFLGNPYPGTLDWDAASWNETGTDGALYTFNTCSQAYASYAGGVGTNGGTNLIPSWQGFHVKAVAASPTLSVTSGALVEDDAALKTTDLSQNILRIFLGDDEIVLRANDNSNESFNVGIDALKFSGDYERVYSQNFGVDDRFSINTFNDTNAHIPIYTRGSGVLSFGDVETWESKYELTLEDLSTGFMYAISPNFQFHYSNSDTVNFENRFVIHLFGGSELGLEDFYEDHGIEVRYDHKDLVVLSDRTYGSVQVQMVNLMGQVVYNSEKVLNQGGFRIPRPDQLMILRIYNNSVNFSQKVK